MLSLYLHSNEDGRNIEIHTHGLFVNGALNGTIQMACAFAYWMWRHPGRYFFGMLHAFLSVLGALLAIFGFMAAILSALNESF